MKQKLVKAGIGAQRVQRVKRRVDLEMKLAVEADARNVFNHVNLQNPNSCVDCSNGGQITDIVGGAVSSLGGMRQLEFGAHLTL